MIRTIRPFKLRPSKLYKTLTVLLCLLWGLWAWADDGGNVGGGGGGTTALVNGRRVLVDLLLTNCAFADIPTSFSSHRAARRSARAEARTRLLAWEETPGISQFLNSGNGIAEQIRGLVSGDISMRLRNGWSRNISANEEREFSEIQEHLGSSCQLQSLQRAAFHFWNSDEQLPAGYVEILATSNSSPENPSFKDYGQHTQVGLLIHEALRNRQLSTARTLNIILPGIGVTATTVRLPDFLLENTIREMTAIYTLCQPDPALACYIAANATQYVFPEAPAANHCAGREWLGQRLHTAVSVNFQWYLENFCRPLARGAN